METTIGKNDKSILVTVISGTEELVIKVLSHHQLSYKVLGYDQSKSAILQIYYGEHNQHAIQEIEDIIKILETLTVILGLSIVSVCQQLKDLNHLPDLKTIIHGNEKRK